MTSQPAKAVHAGLNAMVIDHTFGATNSGSVLLNLCKLPRGAKVVGGTFRAPASSQGDAADTYAILDNEGNQYLDSAVPSAVDDGVSFQAMGLGSRVTGSAHLYLDINCKASTGTSALVTQTTVWYLADDEGD